MNGCGNGFWFFFLGQAAKPGKATGLAAAAAAVDITADEGWGADVDLVLDEEGKEFQDAEDDLLGGADAGGEGEGWEVEGDLELPPDLLEGAKGKEGEDDGLYVVPTRGVSPGQHWANQSRLVGDHVLAGSMDTVFRSVRLHFRSIFVFIKSFFLADFCTISWASLILNRSNLWSC